MGIGAITFEALASITAPAAFPFELPSAESGDYLDTGPVSSIRLPGARRGFMFAGGWDALKHVLTDDVLRTGLLAPDSALTATPSGARATATMDLDADSNATAFHPTDGLTFQLGTSNLGTQTITVVAALTPSLWATHEVLRGANAAEFLANLQALVEQTPGAEGVTHNTLDATQFSQIEVSASDSTSITFQAKDYGTGGNGLFAYLKSGTWSSGGNTASLGSEGTTVGTTGYFESGSNGSGSNPTAGTYQYRYAYKRSEDGAISGYSPVTTTQQGAAQQIALSVIADPDEDDGIDYKRILRTGANGSRFYRVADILAADTTDTDDVSNDTILAREQWNARIYRTYAAGHIPRVRYLVPYKNAWIGGGLVQAPAYTYGTASVSNGSTQVTLTGYPTKAMEHRLFRITTASNEDAGDDYTIVWVDEANQRIYLDREWEGTTNGSRTYEIIDTRDPFRLHRCEPGLPNNVAPLYFQDGIRSPDKRGLTGLAAAWESVIAFTGTGIWRLTGNLSALRLTQGYEGVGCISHHGILFIDGVLYWPGPDGFYAWTGGTNQEPVKISSPPTQIGADVFGIADTYKRINQAHAHGIVGHYDPERRVIRWFVPLDDNTTSKHAIVYQMQTQTWGLDTAPDVTACETVSDGGGNLRTLAGDIYGNVWELDTGESVGSGQFWMVYSADSGDAQVRDASTDGDFSATDGEQHFWCRVKGNKFKIGLYDITPGDGAFGFQSSQAITGSTTRTVTVGGTPFPTAGQGLAGCPAYILDSSGNFTRTVIASNTDNDLTFVDYLSAAPSGTVVVGGILRVIESGWFDTGDPATWKILEAVRTVADTSGSYRRLQLWIRERD